MFLSGRRLHNFTVRTRDNDECGLERLYIDISKWVVRYMVVTVEDGESLRSAYVSPISVTANIPSEKLICVDLTRLQICSSPAADRHRPLTRGLETEINRHYGLDEYWSGTGNWGNTDSPRSLRYSGTRTDSGPSNRLLSQLPLKSFETLGNFVLMAAQGKIGRVTDIMIDERNWKVGYIIIDEDFQIVGTRFLLNPEDFVQAER
jgi:hypothetical protein